MSAVLRTALEKGWNEHTLLRVRIAIAQSPWLSGFQCLQRGCVSSVTLANTLLTTEWFDDETIDACLDAIRLEMKAKAVDPMLKIAGTLLAIFASLPDNNSTRFWGEQLCTGLVKRLLMPGNLDGVHWIVLEVNCITARINVYVGDSNTGKGSKLPLETLLRTTPMLTCLYLHAENFVTSLNSVSPNGVQPVVAVRPHHYMLAPSTDLRHHIAQIQTLSKQLVPSSDAVLKASRSRHKQAVSEMHDGQHAA